MSQGHEPERERIPVDQMAEGGLLNTPETGVSTEIMEARKHALKELAEVGDIQSLHALSGVMLGVEADLKTKPSDEQPVSPDETPTVVMPAVATEETETKKIPAQSPRSEEMGMFAYAGRRISKKLESWSPRRTKLAAAVGVLAVGTVLFVSGSGKENGSPLKAQTAAAIDASPSSS